MCKLVCSVWSACIGIFKFRLKTCPFYFCVINVSSEIQDNFWTLFYGILIIELIKTHLGILLFQKWSALNANIPKRRNIKETNFARQHKALQLTPVWFAGLLHIYLYIPVSQSGYLSAIRESEPQTARGERIRGDSVAAGRRRVISVV